MRHTKLARELGVFVQMIGLAMSGNGNLWLYPSIHLLKFTTARMTGNMH